VTGLHEAFHQFIYSYATNHGKFPKTLEMTENELCALINEAGDYADLAALRKAQKEGKCPHFAGIPITVVECSRIIKSPLECNPLSAEPSDYRSQTDHTPSDGLP
jgi:hypothetical protein